MLASKLGKPRMTGLVAKASREDLLTLNALLEAGAVRPVIDRSYELSEAPEAFRYLSEEHVGGKLVLTV